MVSAMTYVIVMPAQFALTGAPRLSPSDFVLPFLGLIVLATWGLRVLLRQPLVLEMVAVAVAFGMGIVVHFARYGDMPMTILVPKGVGILVVLGSAVVLAPVVARAPMRFAWTAVASTTLVTLVSIYDYIMEQLVHTFTPFSYRFNFGTDQYRLTGLYQDSNAYGGILVMALMLNLCLTTRPPTRPDRLFRDPRPFLQYMATVILVAGIFFTFSRTAWLGTLMGLVAALVLRPRRVGARFGYALALLVPAAGLMLLNPQFVAGVNFLTNRPRPIEARLDQLATGWAWFLERPFLGSGLGSYVRENGFVIHNTLFAALVELGIVGFVVLAAFFAACLWQAFRASRDLAGEEADLGIATTAALVGLLGVSIGVDVLFQRYLWFAVALAIVCGLRLRRSRLAKAAAPRPAPPVGS